MRAQPGGHEVAATTPTVKPKSVATSPESLADFRGDFFIGANRDKDKELHNSSSDDDCNAGSSLMHQSAGAGVWSRASSDLPDVLKWPPPVASFNEGAGKRKEFYAVTGIGKWPSVAGFAQWRIHTRYTVAAAAAYPELALNKLQHAEGFQKDVLTLRVEPEWETLGAKFGKALRPILQGDFAREVATLEEKAARQGLVLLSGWSIYAAINQNFERDAKLARPMAMRDLQLVQMGEGVGALRPFLSKWDAAIERLVQAGGTTDADEDMLYITFKEQFMRCADLKEHIAKVRRSLPSSLVHPYRWMYDAAKAIIEV